MEMSKKWTKEMVLRCFQEDKTPIELEKEMGQSPDTGRDKSFYGEQGRTIVGRLIESIQKFNRPDKNDMGMTGNLW